MLTRLAPIFLLIAAAPLAPAAARNGAPASAAMAVSSSLPELPRVSSYFGVRTDPLLGVRAMHRGVDLPGPNGSPVFAAASGVVRFAGRRGGFGNMVEIEDADGSRTRYAHLSRILVSPGAVVARGGTIALMGSTGRSTGSHLHFEIWLDGRAVDPLPYLSGRAGPPAYTARPISAESALPHRSAFAAARAAARLLPDGESALPAGMRAASE